MSFLFRSPSLPTEARPSPPKAKFRSLSFSFAPPLKSRRSTRPVTKRFASPASNKEEGMSSGVLQWMQDTCPGDVVPKILAFAGPQTMATLSRTSRYWRDAMLSEPTWRTVCEDLYKWSEGDPIPLSWRDYYRINPCVPIDYSSLPAALAFASDDDESAAHDASNMNARAMEQRRNVRILLRPGVYVLRESIVIQAVGNVQVTIETMNLPFSPRPLRSIIDTSEQMEAPSPAKRIAKKAASIRNMLSCRSTALNDVDAMDLEEDVGHYSELPPPPSRASLILKTRRHNEPVFRIRQGQVKMINLEIVHYSHGIDIWNGNAALQIQPPIGPDDHPVAAVPRPTAHLEHVEIVSRSGRGIVNIDGGCATLRNCYVHDCAATGIYVGGPGSHAVIERTDVLHNGNGNKIRRGIGRGHSGIYLEQGTATISDSNISRNSLTGISAVSVDNAILSLEASDLVANGTQQLEMPPNGSVARMMSITRNNNLSQFGYSRSRSGLVQDGPHEVQANA